jgi:hypothetical protein
MAGNQVLGKKAELKPQRHGHGGLVHWFAERTRCGSLIGSTQAVIPMLQNRDSWNEVDSAQTKVVIL